MNTNEVKKVPRMETEHRRLYPPHSESHAHSRTTFATHQGESQLKVTCPLSHAYTDQPITKECFQQQRPEYGSLGVLAYMGVCIVGGWGNPGE